MCLCVIKSTVRVTLCRNLLPSSPIQQIDVFMFDSCYFGHGIWLDILLVVIKRVPAQIYFLSCLPGHCFEFVSLKFHSLKKCPESWFALTIIYRQTCMQNFRCSLLCFVCNLVQWIVVDGRTLHIYVQQPPHIINPAGLPSPAGKVLVPREKKKEKRNHTVVQKFRWLAKPGYQW